MDFAISEKMKTILEMVNEFVDRELIPMEPEMARLGFREMLPVIKEKQKKSGRWNYGHRISRKIAGDWGCLWWIMVFSPKRLAEHLWGIMCSGARHRMQAMWRSCIYTGQRNRKKNFSDRWWPAISGAVFP
jgi:hypothetical protein